MRLRAARRNQRRASITSPDVTSKSTPATSRAPTLAAPTAPAPVARPAARLAAARRRRRYCWRRGKLDWIMKLALASDERSPRPGEREDTEAREADQIPGPAFGLGADRSRGEGVGGLSCLGRMRSAGYRRYRAVGVRRVPNRQPRLPAIESSKRRHRRLPRRGDIRVGARATLRKCRGSTTKPTGSPPAPM